MEGQYFIFSYIFHRCYKISFGSLLRIFWNRDYWIKFEIYWLVGNFKLRIQMFKVESCFKSLKIVLFLRRLLL